MQIIMRNEKLNNFIKEAQNNQRQKELDYEREIAEQEKKFIESVSKQSLFLEQNCRPAVIDEYKDWLAGFLERGGKITHVYDYPWRRWRWYTVTQNCIVPAFYGSISVSLIVPSGIWVTGDMIGHNNLFWVNGFVSSGFVPIFSDIKF